MDLGWRRERRSYGPLWVGLGVASSSFLFLLAGSPAFVSDFCLR